MSLVCDVHRFIYIRVPRTASTTLVHLMNEQYGADLWQPGTQHASAVEMRDKHGSIWNEYRTFGVIRNPWDWLVSFYNSGISAGAGTKELWPGSPCEPVGDPMYHPGQRTNATFDEWVRQRETTPIDWLSDEDGVIVDEVRRFEDFIRTTNIVRSEVPHEHYRAWYSADLADLVARKCAREIEIGGYAF